VFPELNLFDIVIAENSARSPSSRNVKNAMKASTQTGGVDKSFFFRGPDAALYLRAQNLSTFLQLAEGVDDATT
jgi:hypothetical protein